MTYTDNNRLNYAKSGRVVLPEYSHYILQRGHNRQMIFAEDVDCVGI